MAVLIWDNLQMWRLVKALQGSAEHYRTRREISTLRNFRNCVNYIESQNDGEDACTHIHTCPTTCETQIRRTQLTTEEQELRIWGEIGVMKFLGGGGNSMVKNGHLVTQVSHVGVAIWRTGDGTHLPWHPSASPLLSAFPSWWDSQGGDSYSCGTLGNSTFRLKGELQRSPLSAFLLTRTVRWCFSEILGSL